MILNCSWAERGDAVKLGGERGGRDLRLGLGQDGLNQILGRSSWAPLGEGTHAPSERP
jgi:hypothetical protein